MLDPLAQLFQHCCGHAWITKTHGLYSSHDTLQISNLLRVVASAPLPTRTQQLPTLLAQQGWELLVRPFALSLRVTKSRPNSWTRREKGEVMQNKTFIYQLPSMSFCFVSKPNVNLFCKRIIIEVKVSIKRRKLYGYRLVAYSQLAKTPGDFFGYNSG